MLKSCLSGLAVATLVVGGCLAFSGACSPAALAATSQPVPPRPAPSAMSPAQPEPSVDQQMRMFDRRARIDMILYTGRFGPDDRASGRQIRELKTIAVPSGAGTR